MTRNLLFAAIFLTIGVLACSLSPALNAEEPLLETPGASNTAVTPPDLPYPTYMDVQPSDFIYMGAFRLPDDAERPRTFEYGGNAMTFRPGGNSSGLQDGFPGSLYITGHERLPYGELPDGDQVAELTIPAPVISRSLGDLPYAEFIQEFHDVAQGYFTNLGEIPRLGMLYLDHPATGPKIHIAWGQHLQPDPPVASHAWFSPDLSNPDMQGSWFIGDQSLDSVNGYMFEIPAGWADWYVAGYRIATGRYRDGGWSGMGPALFAYQPWLEDGSAPPTGTHLEEIPLLLYEKSTNTDNIDRCLVGYQHADEWEGGAWLTTPTGKSAVLFAGTKSSGTKYWYGYINPAGSELPCVDADLVGQYDLCRQADGTPCPPEDLVECAGHTSLRGWWSTRFVAQFLLYDPSELARVAAGEIASWEPQPYAIYEFDEYLYLDPPEWEKDTLGTGDQRRFRIGDISYDRENGFLYVLELFADGAKPVVHVWQVK